MSDQCALDANGNFKDASEIEFYDSESDAKALPAKYTELHRGTRKRGTESSLTPKKSRTKAPRVKPVPESVSDQEDNDFELPDLVDPSDSEGSDDEMDIDNDEGVHVAVSTGAPPPSDVAVTARNDPDDIGLKIFDKITI
ncbi:hypothetical protein B0H14DRAFT_3451075 [Mycena olivaceomarginata]|nr:hypothetical protein B0H14DRAFT_3451075 [Mycena olivaceomarginata]